MCRSALARDVSDRFQVRAPRANARQERAYTRPAAHSPSPQPRMARQTSSMPSADVIDGSSRRVHAIAGASRTFPAYHQSITRLSPDSPHPCSGQKRRTHRTTPPDQPDHDPHMSGESGAIHRRVVRNGPDSSELLTRQSSPMLRTVPPNSPDNTTRSTRQCAAYVRPVSHNSPDSSRPCTGALPAGKALLPPASRHTNVRHAVRVTVDCARRSVCGIHGGNTPCTG